MNFKSQSYLNHMLKNNITKILDSVLFFRTPKLESHTVPNIYIELKNKSKHIGIPEWANVGHITPPNLIEKTCPEKETNTTTKTTVKCNALLSKYNQTLKENNNKLENKPRWRSCTLMEWGSSAQGLLMYKNKSIHNSTNRLQ